MHKEQDDRLFISQGAVRIALYDDREHSTTHKMLNVLYVDEHNRSLLLILRGVYHNSGDHDAGMYFCTTGKPTKNQPAAGSYVAKVRGARQPQLRDGPARPAHDVAHG